MDNKFYFECVNCGSKYFYDELEYLCPKCEKENTDNAPLKGLPRAVYNYKKILEMGKYLKTFDRLINIKYMDLFPLYSVYSFSYLKIGNTPLYNLEKLNGNKLDFELFVKDDSQNPSYSFKDRASRLVSAYALENDYDTLVCASTGNAGASMATVCASMGQKAVVIVPESAPKAKLMQIAMAGATLIPIKGTYDDAVRLSKEASKTFGWYNRNTAYNPFTTEGKKTVSFEIYKELGQKLPDNIFVSVGDGSILGGVFKGFEDLKELGIIEKLPTIIAVQSENSDNLLRNLNAESFDFKEPTTIADSLKVKIPSNFYYVKYFMEKYNGKSLIVTDEEIINAGIELGKNTGLFTEPASAAAFAGMKKYLQEGNIDKNTKNVVLLTGAGIKDPLYTSEAINLPEAIEPTIDKLSEMVKK